MTQFACRYALIRFLPDTETGEFVNVGVVLLCPQSGYFGFALQNQDCTRVTRFFPEVSPDLYRAALEPMQAELQRMAQVVAQTLPTGRAERLMQVFDGLIHPREALIRFSAARAVLTDNPARQLQHEFDYCVHRHGPQLQPVQG